MKKMLYDTGYGILVLVACVLFGWVGYWCFDAVPQGTGWLSVGLALAATLCLVVFIGLCWGVGSILSEYDTARAAQEDKHAAEAIQGDEDEPQAT